jgi:hypothetical protein
VGTVVERERDTRCTRKRAREMKGARSGREDRGESVADHGADARTRGAEAMKPDLDNWLPNPPVRVAHRRESSATPEALWDAARAVRIADTSLLGRLVRWRIPGISAESSFDELFRRPPFIVLEDQPSDHALVSGLVGRIWTLRRDYPELTDPDEFRRWSKGGTAKVVFAHWVQASGPHRAALATEVRVDSIGVQGRFGLAAVRPLVSAFQNLIGSDGIEAAVRLAERR